MMNVNNPPIGLAGLSISTATRSGRNGASVTPTSGTARSQKIGARLRGSVALRSAALAVLVAGGVSSGAAKAASYEVVYNFGSQANDGTHPYANLMADKSGTLYGTTSQGGANGAGTVFKITPDGTETVLYSFKGGADGKGPGFGTLIEDAAGNLYGTTQFGGVNNAGTIFKLAPDGTETTILTFGGTDSGTNGGIPAAGLIADDKGNLYGTTETGGAFECAPYTGCGTVFELVKGNNSSWTQKILHNFTGADGGYPFSHVLWIGGNLYGTTCYFGTSGWGTVYELVKGKKGEWAEKTLYSFAGGTDGSMPFGDLINDAAGNLYGATMMGGASVNDGVVYKLAPDGTLTILHAFLGENDGGAPQSGLWMAKNGNLFGTTLGGGKKNLGTIFRLTQSGVETVRHSFGAKHDGASPQGFGPLTPVGDYLYGTAVGYGAYNGGVVFRIRK